MLRFVPTTEVRGHIFVTLTHDDYVPMEQPYIYSKAHFRSFFYNYVLHSKSESPLFLDKSAQ